MLSEKGALYMILVQENKPDEIADILRRDYNLHSKVRVLLHLLDSISMSH